MTRAFVTLAVAAFAAAAFVSPAQAYCRGCAVGAGVLGGLAAGAIIGSAIANSQAPAPVYAAPPPADVPAEDAMDSADAICHLERQQVWDGMGYRWQRVEVCD